MIQTRRKRACGEFHRRHGILTCNIDALCGVLRSIHGFVQHGVPILALVVFTWHLDNNSTTRRVVEMRSTDVVESQNFHISGCPPVIG